MSEYDLKNRYFHWLCARAEAVREEGTYFSLFRQLHDTPFRYFVMHDDSRAMDGVALREVFVERARTFRDIIDAESALSGKCSVLEMLIALSDRIAFESTKGNDASYFFWRMLENLGLTAYNDENYALLDGSMNVHIILEAFMDREFDYDGRGSPFPLKNPSCDQRRVELWYEMQAWIQEEEA